MSEQDRGGQAADILEHAERVLIVDDDSSMRTALMESVRRLGFDVQGAVDGADAVERVSRYKPWLVPPAPPALPAQKTEVAVGCKAINIMTKVASG